MKKTVFFIMVAFLVVACEGNEAPIPRETMPEVPTKMESARHVLRPIAAPVGQRGVDILAAAGVEFAFPHKVLYDILDSSAAGTRRHRVLIEVDGGEFGSVAKQFEQSIMDLGYEKVSDKNSNGKIEQVFTADEDPAFYVIAQPAGMGPKLHGKGAVGSIHIMWNIPEGGS